MNTTDIVASLMSESPAGPWPAGAPEQDYLRSPAAARIGRLAQAEQLFLFDYEHRVPLDIPDAWVEQGREADALPPRWTDGQLPERKYQSFRHDLMIGSFHPGHRGKWTTHELCHALVGFAWAPGFSRLEHATAARLAELLPVVLYYFFDELGLRRCPDHQGGGPLYRESCAACEAIAGHPWAEPEDRWISEGLTWLDRELAAISATRRTGRPVAHRWGSLDLCTDGLAYARAHGPRLESEAMERLAPFLVGNAGSLDALEARVMAVTRALLLDESLPTHGGERWDWIRADLAWRVLTIWQQTDGECADALLGLLDDLGPDAPQRWDQLAEDFELPPADAVFAVGYPLGSGWTGCSQDSILAGLRSVCPLVCELAEDAGHRFDFVPPSERRPLGDRFADWLDVHHPALAPLARLEVAMRVVPVDGVAAALGTDGDGHRLGPGVRILRPPYDVVGVSEAVDSGAISGVLVDGRVELDPSPDALAPVLVVTRAPDGELVMAELPADLDLDHPGEEAVDELLALGVFQRDRW